MAIEMHWEGVEQNYVTFFGAMQAKDGDLCCFVSLCPSLQYFCNSGHTLPVWLNLLGCASCLSEGNIL